ncbi:MAG TPA: 5-oxoprolinase subunit PxpA [Saprospiraceae bacterium]|nr:5-oxoprolinase subunit PxpA [Saprospiraceae bacterium]
MTSIDLNCDMGEGMPNDAALMPLISSANIACGYHAGDGQIMQKTITLALEHGVKIGAHPSFPDRENFGRTPMQLPAEEITAIVKHQIELLAELAEKHHTRVHHVKPHGALYNMAWRDTEIATAICKAILETDPSLVLYAQSGSALISFGETLGLQTCSEVFADRSYQPDGSLTPRSMPHALLENDADVLRQVLQMVTQQTVNADGQTIPVRAQTICLHGDGAHAVAFAQLLRETFRVHHIGVLSKT